MVYAVYDKRTQQIYFAESKRVANLFVNDRMRCKDDFIIKKCQNMNFDNVEFDQGIDVFCNRAIIEDEYNICYDSEKIILDVTKNLRVTLKDYSNVHLSEKDREILETGIRIMIHKIIKVAKLDDAELLEEHDNDIGSIILSFEEWDEMFNPHYLIDKAISFYTGSDAKSESFGYDA